jgi:hypothetical protein
MPSPDATPYVDLRLFDKDAQDVFEGALVNLQAYLPEWEPREGHTEVMLMESLALEVAESVFAINRLPGTILEVLMRLYGVDRDAGSPPTATILFTASDDTGHTIPAGTRVALTIAGEEEPVVFATSAAVVIAAGATSATVAAVGDSNTDAANGIVAGTTVDVLDAVVFVERAELASPPTGGALEEDDETWFSRGASRFSRLVETLVLPRHFVSAALERPEVSRASAVDNYDPNQAGVPGDHAGHITLAVYGDGGMLTADAKEIIRATFDLQAQANLAVHVVDPTITTVDVTASLVAKPGFATSDVQAAAVAALNAYLSPEQWPWSATVYRNELIALLDGVDGVERVASITTPAADLALTGVAPLAALGTATITVTS